MNGKISVIITLLGCASLMLCNSSWGNPWPVTGACKDSLSITKKLPTTHDETAEVKSPRPDDTAAQPAMEEWLILGERHAARGDVDKAAEAYRAAIEQKPDWLDPHERLGALYFKSGPDCTPEAIRAYREAARLGSAKAETYYHLGQLYEKRDELDEAVVAYKQALKINPAIAEARLRLVDIRSNRDTIGEAIDQYVEYLKLRPEHADIHLKLARLYVKNSEADRAEMSYRSLLQLSPDSPEGNSELAAIYRAKGVIDRAMFHYEKAVKLKPSDNEISNSLISLYLKEKKYGELTGLLKELIELVPDDPNNHYRLGLMHDFKKEYEQAIACYQKAVSLKSDHARALKALGRLYMKTNRLSEARVALTAAQKADPDLVETTVMLDAIRDDFQPVPQRIAVEKRPAKRKSAAKAKAKPVRNAKVKPVTRR